MPRNSVKMFNDVIIKINDVTDFFDVYKAVLMLTLIKIHK